MCQNIHWVWQCFVAGQREWKCGEKVWISIFKRNQQIPKSNIETQKCDTIRRLRLWHRFGTLFLGWNLQDWFYFGSGNVSCILLSYFLIFEELVWDVLTFYRYEAREKLDLALSLGAEYGVAAEDIVLSHISSLFLSHNVAMLTERLKEPVVLETLKQRSKYAAER